MELVIFGDFNCPYSALASARAARLEATGTVTVDWRAVEHDPTIPVPGRPVTGAVRTGLDEELASIHARRAPDEVLRLRPPAVLPNTAALVVAFAGAPPNLRPLLRRRWFRAVWEDGGDPTRTDHLPPGLPPPAAGEARARRWRAEWTSFGAEVVPFLVLPDGTAAPGLVALDRLAAAWPPAGAVAGGEAPCLAERLDPPSSLF